MCVGRAGPHPDLLFVFASVQIKGVYEQANAKVGPVRHPSTQSAGTSPARLSGALVRLIS